MSLSSDGMRGTIAPVKLLAVDVERFARELPALFDEFPASLHPRDRRFAGVLEGVPGLGCENNLALIALASSLREPGESYVEAGTYRGTSLIAAMLGRSADVVGIDDFSFREGTRAGLDANLERFGFRAEASVLEGDLFELLREEALEDRRVGVFFYDAAHSYRAHLDALRLVEPWLAPRALVIVDDSDWEQVGRATRDYLSAQPRARLLLEIDGKDRAQPHWWEGMQVVAWENG